MNHTGNTILITGGTSGIGLGLATRLHDAGNTVIVAGRRTALLEQIATDHPGIHTVELDVADPASIARVAERLASSHPDLDVLVNNAGMMLREDLRDPTDVQLAEDHVAVNLLGTIRMAYAFIPRLVGRPGATIVNVTSSLAFVPYSATPTYSATKAALHSFTETLRIQLADTGVQVVEIVPPRVRTDLLDQRTDEHAMPLDDYLTEVLDLLRRDPDAQEIVVENARPIRHAVAEGTYAEMLTAFTSV